MVSHSSGLRGQSVFGPRRPDDFFVALSRVADHSVLWVAVSAVLAVGGRRARSGAVRGLAAVVVASAVSNVLLKPAFRRERPEGREPLVRRPGSFAFPSGHSASALAYVVAVSWQLPALAPVLLPLAGAVALSRVRVGVHHHRGDVVLGSAIGAAIGVAVTTARQPRSHGLPPLLTEAVLVVSPRAAGGRDLAVARRELRRLGLKVTAELDVRQVSRLAGILADHGGRPVLVVAAGGDGTAGAVSNVLAGTGHVLGLLPLGTSNNFARSLGIPVDPRRAAGLFAEGKVAAVDLGRFAPEEGPSRYFAHAAAVGLNAGFARIAARDGLRDRLGRLACLAAARAMRGRRPFTCELQYLEASESRTLTQLSVINAPAFGGPLRLSAAASDPDDRLLNILTVDDVPPVRMLLAAVPVVLHDARPVPGITARHAASVSVRAGGPLEVTLDGEVAGILPGSFEVSGDALRVITPLGFTDIDDIPDGGTE